MGAPANRAPRGSSPLTRGKHPALSPLMRGCRLIPAHAGKTDCRSARGSGVRAHPRSRGENASMRMDVSSELGSSPLTRGKPTSIQAVPRETRLIPAHAGKTGASIKEGLGSAAHPRSRGENAACLEDAPCVGGSSPLTRGKPGLRVVYLPGPRLIPAHAGKTAVAHMHAQVRQAHPRSRGENCLALEVGREFAGSSPLTRGKLP